MADAITDEQLAEMSPEDLIEQFTDEPSEDSEEAPETTEDDFVSSDGEEDEYEAEETDESDEESDEPETEIDHTEEDLIDFEAEYNKIFKPFKANHREVTVRSTDEVIKLMQMGVGSNAKNRKMNEHAAIIEQLRDNDLMDSDKLNYLIDLNKQDPEAIKKLIKSSGIDLLDYDEDEESTYVPTDHSVSSVNMQLRDTLDELSSSDSYNETLQVLASPTEGGWDQESTDALFAEPSLISLLNGHMETGVYDKIRSEIERERDFGGLKGLSDLDAYNEVGVRLEKEGQFNTAPAPQEAPISDEANEINRRRKAAGATGGKRPTSKKKGIPKNVLSMSEEDFMKLDFNSL